MSIERSKSRDLDSLANASRSGSRASEDTSTLRPSGAGKSVTSTEPQNLVNLNYTYGTSVEPGEPASKRDRDPVPLAELEREPTVQGRSERKRKQAAKDNELLKNDHWLVRNGHFLTYICLFLFSAMVFFRPYEIVPGLAFLSGTAVVFAVVTLAVYVPSQIATEGNLTILSTEVKAILAMTLIALITMPIAKNPGMAWELFSDTYVKAVAIFIVLVNVVRTRKRLMGLIWLSLGIGVYLAIETIRLYMAGEFSVEGYRVAIVEVRGIFGNPNEMAMHFVMMTPLVITLGIAAKSQFIRMAYFAMALLFLVANMFTFSRGGFLGLLVMAAVLSWKLGRKHRVNVTIGSLFVGGIFILAAPGNYGLRLLSIFIPGLDAAGSSDQRQELLIRSLQVTARNPWGIGMGNFPIVGIRNLQSHNAYTQVSAELGILGLIAYIIFMVSPFRKLGAIERTLFNKDDLNWFYYLAIGLQASIIGYMVSSFFASVAYNWFIYYLIAYAVAFRRIYSLENGLTEDIKPGPLWDRQPVTST